MNDINHILKLAGLQEADVIRTASPEMDDYHDEKAPEETYMVAWSAQSYEWYGQGDPEEGNGRYKPKGDGGEVIAINIPDERTAHKLLDDLNKRLESEDFGVYGKDPYCLSDIEAHVDTMTNYKKRFTYGGSFDQEYFDYETKNAKDFSKKSALESIKEEIQLSLKKIKEEPLELHKQGMFTTYQNSRLALAGGIRSGSSEAGCTRLKYVIYDLVKFEETNNYDSSEVGYVELFVDDKTGEILGLVNIVIKPKLRKSGYGAMIIQDLKDTVKDGFTIHDIQKKAQGFWNKVGVEYDSKLKRNGRIQNTPT